MLTSILPMDTRRVALAGMKNILISFLPSALSLVPCPVPFLQIRIRIRADALTRWSLVEGVFFRVAVYVYVCLFVFLRKDNINDSILNSLNGYLTPLGSVWRVAVYKTEKKVYGIGETAVLLYCYHHYLRRYSPMRTTTSSTYYKNAAVTRRCMYVKSVQQMPCI